MASAALAFTLLFCGAMTLRRFIKSEPQALLPEEDDTWHDAT